MSSLSSSTMSCSLSLFASCACSAVHHVLALWSHYVLALVSSDRIMCSLLWLYYVLSLVALCSRSGRIMCALLWLHYVFAASGCIMCALWSHYVFALVALCWLHYLCARSGCIICVLALGSARIMWCFRLLCASSLVRVNYPHYVLEFALIMRPICKM